MSGVSGQFFKSLIWENISLDCEGGLALDFFESSVVVACFGGSIVGWFPSASKELNLECPGNSVKEQLAKVGHLMNFNPRSHF